MAYLSLYRRRRPSFFEYDLSEHVVRTLSHALGPTGACLLVPGRGGQGRPPPPRFLPAPLIKTFPHRNHVANFPHASILLPVSPDVVEMPPNRGSMNSESARADPLCRQ